MILTEFDHFKIAVNNIHFTEFKHRIPLNLVSVISINGDTTISFLIFKTSHSVPPSAPPPKSDCPYPTEPFGMPSIMPSASTPCSSMQNYNPSQAPYSSISGPYPPPTYDSKGQSSYQQYSGMTHSQHGAPYPQQGMPYGQQSTSFHHQGKNKYNPSSNLPPVYP